MSITFGGECFVVLKARNVGLYVEMLGRLQIFRKKSLAVCF